MSCSEMVWATLVMLPASLVRVRALKALSCLITYSGCSPATRGISFCPENPPRWHMVHNTSLAFLLPRATRPGGGLPGLHISGQREYYDAVAALEVELRISARGDGDVLFAPHHVGHRRRVDAGAGLVLPQQVTGRRVQRLEEPVALAEEHDTPGSGKGAADQGLLGVVLPSHLAGIDVDRREASPLLLAGDRLERAAEPQLAAARVVRGLDVIGHRLMQVERVGEARLRAEGHRRPLDPAVRARQHARALRGRQHPHVFLR